MWNSDYRVGSRTRTWDLWVSRPALWPLDHAASLGANFASRRDVTRIVPEPISACRFSTQEKKTQPDLRLVAFQARVIIFAQLLSFSLSDWLMTAVVNDSPDNDTNAATNHAARKLQKMLTELPQEFSKYYETKTNKLPLDCRRVDFHLPRSRHRLLKYLLGLTQRSATANKGNH